jgi:hypothetical protein
VSSRERSCAAYDCVFLSQKTLCLKSSGLRLLSLLMCSGRSSTDQTVTSVDLVGFLGNWYVISFARFLDLTYVTLCWVL